MTTEPVLSIENLRVQFGKQAILKNLSFSVRKGEIVGIIGPNGCGKTTLLNAISGFCRKNEGKIFIEGNDISEMKNFDRARKFVGRSFQNVGVFKELTLEENLMMVIERENSYPWYWMFSNNHKISMSQIIDKALDELGLLHHKKSQAGILSGGQLRLLELARLKLMNKPLLLIDEPTAGVAPILRQELGKTIGSLASKHGHTIIIVEHDLKFLFGIVNRVIVIVDGEIYMDGSPEEIKNDHRLQEVYFGK
jgi:branched-chain amino acid transport system ATP-binding protein